MMSPSTIAVVLAKFLAIFNFYVAGYTQQANRGVRTCVTFPLLKLLHALALVGKVSTYDMYRSIEKLTNDAGIRKLTCRYRPTMRCLNQWRHLKALKRGGRAHDRTGADGTSDGELAILCPSCPHPGINIPNAWGYRTKGENSAFHPQ